MLRANLPFTYTRGAVNLTVVIVLGIALWLASCHVAATTVDTATPTPIPPRPPATTPVATSASDQSAPPSAMTTTAADQACAPGALAETDEIVIGALAPLSKPGAMQSGFAMQTAFNLAVAEINAQGGVAGKPLRLIAYDTAGLPEQGARFAERLITQDCAVALVGVYHSQVAVAVKAVVQRLHRPIIFVDPYLDEITVDQTPEVFRIAPTSSMLAQMPGQWLTEVGDYNQDGEKFVAVVVENTPYGVARVESAQKWLPQAGFTLESVQVDVPITDYQAVIARLVALEHMPDAVFLYLHDDAVYDLTQALIAAGIGPQKSTLLVINQPSGNDQTFWARVPAGLLTVMPHIGPWPATTTAKGQQFAEQYRIYFERWPESYAFAAYDSVWLVADAISRTQSLTSADLITALEASDVELAAGRYTFPYNAQNPPDGTTVPAYMWHQRPNPPFYYLQYTEPQQATFDATIIWPPDQRTSPGPVVRPVEQTP